MRRTITLLTVVSLLTLLLASPVAAEDTGLRVPAGAAAKQSAVYVIQLAADPVVAYDGDVRGLPGTKPEKGKKINPNSASVKRYVAHLVGQHDAVLRAVGGAEKVYHYTYSFNGFAAVLTPHQAAQLEGRDDVLAVWTDERRQLTTDNSPEFLGLSAPGGLWEQAGGVEAAGEDVIVGVIDTGIWPEHPSFSDQDDLADRPGSSGKRTRVYDALTDWFGTCQAGEQWSKDDCNSKLIGARYFLSGFTHAGIIQNDYKSTRDADGHGTHTASTAAGNAGVEATVLGAAYGTISGMAPRARIAAYKGCWNGEGCFTSDLVAAIDQAVADGVDVINYSIGSSAQTLVGPDDVAFLFAADAGVFVATSAGNAGPGASSVGSPATVPWITSVAASTQDRTFLGTVTLGDSSTYTGVTITGGTDGPLPLIDSEDVTPFGGFTEDETELCNVGSLTPSEVAGKVVLCKRGVIARVAKSLAVAQAGGAGMVLYNAVSNDTLNTDNHYVPSLHVSFEDGTDIKAYIDGAGTSATAALSGGSAQDDPGAPDIAAFSSRGPNGAAQDIIKPDVTAPGVNILAGNTPTAFLGAPGELFQAISGTSMSSPHVAGVGALLVQAHPEWSPAAIKSALMTTAYQGVDKEDGVTSADPFDMGAGHIDPNPATDPGLVYEAGFFDYLAFLCGATSAVSQGACDFLAGRGFSFDASDLNLASIGIGELAGFQTISRTVTNVGGSTATYNATVAAPAGIDVVVSPTTLELDSGESATYEVTFTTTSAAALEEWAFGSLTWSDGSHSVRSPIAIKPVALAAPAEQMGTGTGGSLSYDVTFGYDGPFSADPWGLVAAGQQPDSVVDDPANDINTALSTGVGITVHSVTIPAGTEYTRFSLFDDYTDGADDLDLYVFGPAPDFPFVGGSGSGTSAEEVNLDNPTPGNYVVVVHGWQTDGPDANYTLFTWNVPGTDSGNMTVTEPATAVLGDTGTVTVQWSGLSAGTKYLGAAGYNGGADGRTIIRIDTD